MTVTGEYNPDSAVNEQPLQSQLDRISPTPHQTDCHVCTQDSHIHIHRYVAMLT